MATIFLTDPIHAQAERLLREHAEVLTPTHPYGPDELAQYVSQADIVIVRRQLPCGLIAGCARLRATIRHGAGLDFIPVEEASRAGVAVTNVPGANAECVAEHALGLALALCRRIARFDRRIRAGEWAALRGEIMASEGLRGRTAGIVGFGRIGREIAKICRFGFGMNIVAVSRRNDPALDWVSFADLDTVFAESDLVFVACPLNDETRGLIGRRQLERLGGSGFLVNIARGPIADEAALLEALRAGTIAGAGLDVFESQPLAADHAFRRLENVVMTPHVAGISRDSMKAMSEGTVADAIAIMNGERPRYLVNVDAWPRIERRWRALDALDRGS